jgi:hypothetical protein
MTDKPIEERGTRSRAGWFEAANIYGFYPTDEELHTGWSKWLSVNRAVILQSPDDTKYQKNLRRLLIADCERGACVCRKTQKRAGGTYILGTDEDGQGFRHQTPERTEKEYLVEASAFKSWLYEQDLVPSKHVTAWDVAINNPVPAQNAAITAPVVTGQSGGDGIDFAVLASREQLITAFGSFTGMDAGWFANVKDTPALLAARKVTGQGGRGHIAGPLFSPFEVLQWLINPVRRKGRKLSEHKGWELFESHFPRAYAAYSVGDPRPD